MTFAHRSAGTGRLTAPEPPPERINWAVVRPRGLDFLLAIVGVAVSWIPARDPSFFSMSVWDAVGAVAVYALVGYLLVLLLAVLARQLAVLIRRALSYAVLYSYAERMHAGIVRERIDSRGLAQTVTFLCEIVKESTFEINDVAMNDDGVELILALNGVIAPRSGDRLLVMDRRGGPVMGHLRVLAVSDTTFRAALEYPDTFWSGYIHDTVNEHRPFETTARAILMEHPGTEELP